MSTENDKADLTSMKEWVATWQHTGKKLEELRLKELPNVDTASAIKSFDKAFTSAMKEHKNSPTSGLVELQQWLTKLRRTY